MGFFTPLPFFLSFFLSFFSLDSRLRGNDGEGAFKPIPLRCVGLSFFCPEGATYTSLGHRPRNEGAALGSQSTALASLNSPLQGFAFFALFPRALPWAILFCPFRANAIAKQEFNFACALKGQSQPA
jgi:hypothetical protein